MRDSRPKSTKNRGAKKIQEEYSMFEEEEKLGEDDDELEDIMEEPIEEESEDSYSEATMTGAPGRQSKKKKKRVAPAPKPPNPDEEYLDKEDQDRR